MQRSGWKAGSSEPRLSGSCVSSLVLCFTSACSLHPLSSSQCCSTFVMTVSLNAQASSCSLLKSCCRAHVVSCNCPASRCVSSLASTLGLSRRTPRCPPFLRCLSHSSPFTCPDFHTQRKGARLVGGEPLTEDLSDKPCEHFRDRACALRSANVETAMSSL